MFERFTEKSINVITCAQQEAKDLNNKEVLPEHLLLGIVEQKSGIAPRFLRVAGVTSEILKEKLSQTLSNESESNSDAMPPFSNSVKKVLTNAWDKARAMDDYYISPSHLFLALIQVSPHIIDLLKSLDTNTDRIIDSVKRVVEKRAKTTEHPESISKNLRSNFSASASIFNEKSLESMMQIAQDELKSTNYENLGTEQLLMAMLENQESTVAKSLIEEGLSKEFFEEKINGLSSRIDEYEEDCNFTPKALNAIDTAYDMAKELGSTNILPEHILLGILKEKGGIAYKVLKDSKINTEKLYEKLLRPIEKQKPETLTIVRLAREEARRLGHSTVGTELILLGILVEGASMGYDVLKSLDVTVKDARNEVEKLIGYGNEYSDSEITLTPRAKKLLQIAWEKAKKFHRQKIEAIHLLLGITKQSDCVAMKVLENLGVDVLEIRQGILKELDI